MSRKPHVVQKIGNSLFVSIPVKICKQLEIDDGDFVRVDLEDKRIIVVKVELAEGSA